MLERERRRVASGEAVSGSYDSAVRVDRNEAAAVVRQARDCGPVHHREKQRPVNTPARPRRQLKHDRLGADGAVPVHRVATRGVHAGDHLYPSARELIGDGLADCGPKRLQRRFLCGHKQHLCLRVSAPRRQTRHERQLVRVDGPGGAAGNDERGGLSGAALQVQQQGCELRRSLGPPAPRPSRSAAEARSGAWGHD